jgi:hypothetical protein
MTLPYSCPILTLWPTPFPIFAIRRSGLRRDSPEPPTGFAGEICIRSLTNDHIVSALGGKPCALTLR